ncbi:MAG: 50S ribosomal protein L22 [Candidatus Margulisbacteria bacterium]|nr:50S ribosomal protein L22 [Candidatus Margulisiibacteriota bacterium]
MRVIARSKWIKISPRKLGLVAKLVRGKLVAEALRLLQFLPNKGARIMEKVIKSAAANAKNNYKMKEEGLVVSEAFANKAVTMRRWQPRARGRIFPINKRTSHVTVYVTSKQDTVSKEES